MSDAMGFIIIGVIFVAIVFFAVKLQMKDSNATKKNIKRKEDFLKSNGFKISRRIGDYKAWGINAYYMYIDDTNKKWFVTSPLMNEMGKIRNFSDVVEYGYFDEDGLGITSKYKEFAVKGAIGIASVIAGYGFGGLITGTRLGGSLGALGGFVLAKKANQIIPQGNGDSVSYGLVVMTKDCNDNNPALVYDFKFAAEQGAKESNIGIVKLAGKVSSMSSEAGFQGTDRGSAHYKKNIEAIQNMAAAFDSMIAGR